MNAKTRLAALAAAAALAAPPLAGALALRTGAGRTVVRGLEPGRPCPLERCAGGPLTVFNSGTEAASVTLRVEAPGPADLQDGYEPAPSEAWVRLERGLLSLDPGRGGGTGGVVTVPARRGLGRGQYQLDWLAEGVSESGLTLRLRSRLLLRVDDGDDEDWRRERGRSRRRDAEVKLLGGPARGLKAGLRWANAGDRPQTVRVRVGVPGSEEKLPPGYEPCPNPAFLEAPRRVKAGAGELARAELSPRVPDQPRYRGRKWAFEVATQALEGPDEEERTLVLMDTGEVFAAR